LASRLSRRGRCMSWLEHARLVVSLASEALSRTPRLVMPGILLGIGFGGFVDGIVLHQILQWHHMLTSEGDFPATTVMGLEDNTLADGLFHVATWVAAITGLVLLWRSVRGQRRIESGRVLFGWMLIGWGLFNLVEGVIDHHILGIHHVRAGDQELAYDLGFLGLGAALFVSGWLLARTGLSGRGLHGRSGGKAADIRRADEGQANE
jgi:uncharacterized membrane protein